MSQKRLDGPIQDPQTDLYEGRSGIGMTRREWIHGSAAVGAMLVLNAEAGLAEATAASQLLVVRNLALHPCHDLLYGYLLLVRDNIGTVPAVRTRNRTQ